MTALAAGFHGRWRPHCVRIHAPQAGYCAVTIHRFPLIRTWPAVYKYSFRCIQFFDSGSPSPQSGVRRAGAGRRRRRHRLHRPGAAAAAGAPSGGHADRRDVVGRDRGAAAAGAGPPVERQRSRRSIARRARARGRRRLPGAARRGGRGAGAGAGRRRRARHRSVRRLPAARRRRGRDGIRKPGALPDGHGLRPHRAGPRRGRAARGWSPTPAAIRPRRCWRWRRWRARACWSPAPTSSSTPSRASRAPARRRPSARISPKCTAACRPTACSATATAPRSSRSSAATVTFTPHLRAARSRHPRRRSTCGSRRARPKTRSATVYEQAYARRAVRPAGRRRRCRKSSTSRTPTSATSAGGSMPSGRAVLVSVIDNLLKGASGQAVQNMNVMLGLDEAHGAAVSVAPTTHTSRPLHVGRAAGPQVRRRAARGSRAAADGRRGDRAASPPAARRWSSSTAAARRSTPR